MLNPTGPWACHPNALRAMHQAFNPAAFSGARSSQSRAYRYDVVDGVAIVGIDGMMTKHTWWDDTSSTVALRGTVRQLTADDAVRSVVLRISSPGGEVAGAYDLADDVAALNRAKPTYAYAEDLCASAAYLIASQCRQISANRNALVGSIGTYGVVTDFSKMAEKDGVTVHVIRAGKFKGAGEFGTSISDEQLAMWQAEVDDVNKLFLDAVSRGRRTPLARVQELADGRAYIAAKARQLGLVDRVESLDALLSRVTTGQDAPADFDDDDDEYEDEPRSRRSSSHARNQSQVERMPAVARRSKTNPITDFQNRVAAKMKSGLSKRIATSAVIREDPAAHERFLLATNGRQVAGSIHSSAAPMDGPQRGGPAAAKFFRLVAVEHANGKSRRDAVTAVQRANPNLHRQMLQECNPGAIID